MNVPLKILLYIIAVIACVYLGNYLRTIVDARQTKKLIIDLEKYWNQDLPYYKHTKDYRSVNWKKVMRMLKQESEPDSKLIADFIKLVDKQILLYDPKKSTKK